MNENVKIVELNRQILIMKRFRDWQRWKVLLPILMLFLFYPIYIFEEKELMGPFLSAFAHGDLLLFSALLLFEVSVEANHIQHELGESFSETLDNIIERPRIFGIILIVVYGAMKLAIGHDNTTNSPNFLRTAAYCVFCISVAILVVTYSIYAFWKTLEKVVEK
ncbi:MAG: hypothetical protein WBV94_30700 [Blastocatellia bacterium]